MIDVTLNNLIALLDECLHNGDIGKDSLFAWFSGERSIIEQTLKDAEYYEETLTNPKG